MPQRVSPGDAHLPAVSSRAGGSAVIEATEHAKRKTVPRFEHEVGVTGLSAGLIDQIDAAEWICIRLIELIDQFPAVDRIAVLQSDRCSHDPVGEPFIALHAYLTDLEFGNGDLDYA